MIRARLFVTLLLMASAGHATAQETLRIALLPVVVHSSESQEYLRAGLADMLSSRLQQVSDLDVVEIDDPSAATTRLGLAIDRAQAVKADFVLFGSFTRFGQGASLDMQCASTAYDASQTPLREIFVHSGSIGDVIPDLDELVGKVSRFVLEGSSGSAVAGTGAGGSASREGFAELEQRIKAIEDALGLSPNAGPAIPLPAPGG